MTNDTAHDPGTDIVGTTEIAQRLKIASTTVRAWRHRGHLPKPDGHIGKHPWWYWDTVATKSPLVARYLAEQARDADAEAPTPEGAEATP